jgi:hypothetical protein
MRLSISLFVLTISYTCPEVTNFVHEAFSNFLMHLFSKAWMRLSSCVFSFRASHSYVAIGQTRAFINRSLVMVTDLYSISLSTWPSLPCPWPFSTSPVHLIRTVRIIRYSTSQIHKRIHFLQPSAIHHDPKYFVSILLLPSFSCVYQHVILLCRRRGTPTRAVLLGTWPIRRCYQRT